MLVCQVCITSRVRSADERVCDDGTMDLGFAPTAAARDRMSIVTQTWGVIVLHQPLFDERCKGRNGRGPGTERSANYGQMIK